MKASTPSGAVIVSAVSHVSVGGFNRTRSLASRRNGSPAIYPLGVYDRRISSAWPQPCGAPSGSWSLSIPQGGRPPAATAHRRLVSLRDLVHILPIVRDQLVQQLCHRHLAAGPPPRVGHLLQELRAVDALPD